MTLRIRLSKTARQQAYDADEWWQTNRRDAPDAFWDEFIAALERIADNPEIGLLAPRLGVRGLRRVLLDASETHVYYARAPRSILVHAVWGARKGTMPPLRKTRRKRR